jgi:hypothetical protein
MDRMEAMGALGLVLLACHVAAFLTLVVSVALQHPVRGIIAFVVPPFGLVWGWELGKKKQVMAYGVTMALFALYLVVVELVR